VFSGGTKKFTPDQKLSMICYMCSTSWWYHYFEENNRQG
jgi:hypothetical protein